MMSEDMPKLKIQRTTLQNYDKKELQIGNTQWKQAYDSNPS